MVISKLFKVFCLLKVASVFKSSSLTFYTRGRQTAARGPIAAREGKICCPRARNFFELNVARKRKLCGPRACKCGPQSKNISKLIFLGNLI